MNIEQIINEMQVSLTKLRGQLRLTGTAGECVCPPTTMYPPGGMANEPVSINVDCPVHGKSTWWGKPQCGYGHWTCNLPMPKGRTSNVSTETPDLPLHVRVAKALGKRVFRDHVAEDWKDADTIKPIFPYDTDLVAATDGGLRYMEIINKNRPVSTLEFRMRIDFYGDLSGTVSIVQPDALSPDTKNRYELVVHFGKHSQECCEANGMLWAETKTEAICEAIVAHAEGK